MTASPFDLTRLLSPLAIDEFFSAYWEQRHWLLSRDQPHCYDSLITAADLENIISNSDGRYPAIRLAKGGGYFPPEAYTRNVKHGDESFVGVPDLKRIADEYRRGATVALPALHRSWKPLGFKDVRYQVTAPVAAAIRAMVEQSTFRGADLSSPLDPESRRVLIQHLVDIGFLSLA